MNYNELSDDKLLGVLGMDAAKWTAAFMQIGPGKVGHVDADAVLGWFANAIMAGYDEARRRDAAAIAALEARVTELSGQLVFVGFA